MPTPIERHECPQTAEEMLRPVPVAPQEEHREQVEIAAHVAPPAVLRVPGRATPVGDLHLGDAEPGVVGEHGDVAMQLAVDVDAVDDLAPVDLEAAVEVVQLEPCATLRVAQLKKRDGSVLVIGSLRVAASSPRPGRTPRRGVDDHARDLGRVVLAVAVHGHDDVAASLGETLR